MTDKTCSIDWWSAGFDDYFRHVTGEASPNPPIAPGANAAWYSGYEDASDYSHGEFKERDAHE